MTYSDSYNIRETSVTFNDVADAIDGTLTRNVSGVTSGTSTAYVASPSPAWLEYVNGSFLVITPHVSNTGPCNINVSSLGVRDLKIAGQDLAAGVLVAGVPTILVYNGVHFEVLLQNVAIPVGTIQSYAGTSAPTGWLICDGAEISRTTYANLFALIGEAFGAGDSSTTFNLPDLKRRMPVGKGSSDSIGDSDGLAEGSRGLTHTHSVPAHYHGKGDLNVTSSGTHTTSIQHDHASFNATGNTSGGGAHTHGLNMAETGGAGSGRYVIRDLTPSYLVNTGGGHQAVQSVGNHTHPITLAINVPSFSGNSASNGAHTHANSSFSGSVGNTGGEDGDSAFDSGAGGQPYLIVNYIIRA